MRLKTFALVALTGLGLTALPHASLAINSAYFSDGIKLAWGPDGYDTGLDNILFDVRAVARTPSASPDRSGQSGEDLGGDSSGVAASLPAPHMQA